MIQCRVCGSQFTSQPLLRYNEMPKSAQFLPAENELELDKGVSFDVCQCSGCGLIQLSSEPVHYYREVIRAATFSNAMKEFRKKQFENFIEKYGLNKKKIIEIGCGRGDYLEILQQLPINSVGLEYSESSVEYCRQNGLTVYQGFVEDSSYKIQDSPFDAFLILNFLEHLPRPGDVLKGIRTNLLPGGLGIVEVPNFDMIIRKNIFSEFVTDHLFYFTRETLSTLMQINGFEVVDISEIWNDYIISFVVKVREPLVLSNFDEFQDKIVRQIKSFISNYGNKRVAIWGAGHQAFAVMSMANLTGSVKYVVDSAPFKQNRYTPATHIPIVSPVALTNDPVDAIIIMAGGYSDEVAKIVMKQFNGTVTTAIVRDFGLEII